MKDQILGITLLVLLFIGSSDVIANTEHDQETIAILSAFQCAAVYKTYGGTSNYKSSVYEAGITIRKNAVKLADYHGIGFSQQIQMEIETTKQAQEMLNKSPYIPPSIDNFCTGVLDGSSAAVERI